MQAGELTAFPDDVFPQRYTYRLQQLMPHPCDFGELIFGDRDALAAIAIRGLLTDLVELSSRLGKLLLASCSEMYFDADGTTKRTVTY